MALRARLDHELDGSLHPFSEAFNNWPSSALRMIEGGREMARDSANASRDARFAIEAAVFLDDVRNALEKGPLRARDAALRLVGFLSAKATAELRPARGGLAPWQKQKIDLYLRTHLKHPGRVDKLAEQVSLSVSHFCRAFKTTFGHTPHIYIIRLRLELAQKLMLTTDEPLSQIAITCGLADQAHLTKLFRRWLNESPSAWRRRNLTEFDVSTRTRQPVATSDNPGKAQA